MNRRPIRPIFHRFQNLPASCERSLRFLSISSLRGSFLILIETVILRYFEQQYHTDFSPFDQNESAIFKINNYTSQRNKPNVHLAIAQI